jgi:hypothetical protein
MNDLRLFLEPVNLKTQTLVRSLELLLCDLQSLDLVLQLLNSGLVNLLQTLWVLFLICTYSLI